MQEAEEAGGFSSDTDLVSASIFTDVGAGYTAFNPQVSGAVVLGTDVKVEVTGPDLEGFYIKQCKAVNNNNVNPTNSVNLGEFLILLKQIDF